MDRTPASAGTFIDLGDPGPAIKAARALARPLLPRNLPSERTRAS